jgi:hypothetical protein
MRKFTVKVPKRVAPPKPLRHVAMPKMKLGRPKPKPVRKPTQKRDYPYPF